MSGTAKNASERLQIIKGRMQTAVERFDNISRRVELVAVSKTFEVSDIVPLIEAGQRVFGENRVQEAQRKWPELRAKNDDLDLHLIGPLQTNKVKDAVALFDVIESVDRDKLAKALAKEMTKQDKNIPCFVQVNIGGEEQKSGCAIEETENFVQRCREEYGLNIVGLMCVPPAGEAPGPYFAHLAQLAKLCGLSQLSMGMSGDFETAIGMGSTQIRVGSALFGTRP